MIDITPIIQTCITVGGSLIISFGTWHVSMKSARDKDTKALTEALANHKDEMKEALNAHKEEMDDSFRDLQDEVSSVNATVQTQIALVNTKLETLSDRVERHNNVIERTYKLERDTSVMAEQIKVANHRIEDLGKKQ